MGVSEWSDKKVMGVSDHSDMKVVGGGKQSAQNCKTKKCECEFVHDAFSVFIHLSIHSNRQVRINMVKLRLFE